jgi:hypothetical protein
LIITEDICHHETRRFDIIPDRRRATFDRPE